MNGSLAFADVVALLDSLKRRDYWQVASRAVSILNSFFNPPALFGVAGAPQPPVTADQDWDTVLDELESEMGNVSGEDGPVVSPGNDPTRLDTPTTFTVGGVLALVDLIITLYGRFRKPKVAAPAEPVKTPVKVVPQPEKKS